MQRGSGKAILRATAYLRGYRRDALGAFVALLLVSGANLVSPQLIRLAIDEGIAEENGFTVVREGREWSGACGDEVEELLLVLPA